MTQEIRTHYFGEGGKISKKSVNGLGNLLSDAVFIYYIDQVVKSTAEKSLGKTFYYKYLTYYTQKKIIHKFSLRKLNIFF